MRTGVSGSTSELGRVFRLCMSVVLAALVPLVMASLAHAAEIRVAAPTMTIELVLKPLQAPFERATGITLSIRDLDSRDALPLLQKGKVDMLATSQSAEEYLREAARSGVEPAKETIQTHVIAQVPLSVIVHKASPIGSLSREQLRGIFSGSMRSWDRVGGEDVPIDLFLYENYNPYSTIQHTILGEEEMFPEIKMRTTPEEVRAAVAATTSAIAIIPAALANDSVKKVESPEIAQQPAFLTNGEPSAKVQKFIEFAKGEGQAYLKIFPTR